MGQKLDRYLETRSGKDESKALELGRLVLRARKFYNSFDKNFVMGEDDFVIGYLNGAIDTASQMAIESADQAKAEVERIEQRLEGELKFIKGL